MKQKFIILALIFAGFSLNLNAQIDVTVNPIGLLFSNINAGADIGFAEDMSVEPRIGLSFNNYTLGDADFSSTGFAIGAIGKYYFSPDDGCDKWHVGPYLDFGTSTLKADMEADVTNTKFGLGLYVGYKWVSAKNIVFDLGFGGGRNFINKFEASDGSETDLGGIPLLNINLTGKLAVGYRFGGGK